ncbi:MAG TPA: acyltransferase [Bacteroidales bacterium]|nr:acyltransferase [Bacteroidales bacterium]
MRIKGLDFLRGIAVILVIFRHASSGNIISDIGWIGVDLFFVLSGFLVAGLVFKEYLDYQKVDITRFLVRRGFKIYPPFYFFIFITIVLNYIQTKGFYSLSQVLNEIFYLQSYRRGIWHHTWSLAIEEHFYIGLALFILICIRTKLIENKKFIGYFLICMLILSFLMRFYISYQNRDKLFFSFTATHLRMDGILIGVLTSYLYYFTDFYKLFSKCKYWFFVFASILISPVFFFSGGSYFMNTIGLTTVNLGFGLLVLFSLNAFKISNQIFLPITKIPFMIICFIGIHSYSIYLWHLMSEKIVRLMDCNQQYYFILFLIVSISLGVTMSYAIEKPFLGLRDIIYKRK